MVEGNIDLARVNPKCLLRYTEQVVDDDEEQMSSLVRAIIG